MEKQVREVLGLMQKNLECAICLDLLKNPVSTKCDHQFCRFCIQEFLKTKASLPCPLCKKPITKRSLVDRTNLSHIVENVRSLISAFQEDTGELFSPPRGSQMCFLPCTPESISAKSSNGNKRKSAEDVPVEPKNVRKSKRRKSEPAGRGSHLLNQTEAGEDLGEITQALLAEIEAGNDATKSAQVGNKHVSTIPSKSSTLTNNTENKPAVNHWASVDVSRGTRHNGRLGRGKEKAENSSNKCPQRTCSPDPLQHEKNLVNYLANESCGALDTDNTNKNCVSHSTNTTSRRLMRSRSSEKKHPNGSIIVDVSDEEKAGSSSDEDDTNAVGHSLISLGNRAEKQKSKLERELVQSRNKGTDSLIEAGRSEMQQADEQVVDDGWEEESDLVQNKTRRRATKSTNLTVSTGEKRETRSTDKNKMEQNWKKSCEDKLKVTEEEDCTQISNGSMQGCTGKIFSTQVHNVSRTYSRKSKNKTVKSWLNKIPLQDPVDVDDQDLSPSFFTEDDVELTEEEENRNSCFGFSDIEECQKVFDKPETIRKQDRAMSSKEAHKLPTQNPVISDGDKSVKNHINEGKESKNLESSLHLEDNDLHPNKSVEGTVSVCPVTDKELPEVTPPVQSDDIEKERSNEDALQTGHLTPRVGKRKKIFKSKANDQSHVNMSVTQHKGKISVTKVMPESVKGSGSKLLQHGKQVAMETNRDSQGSDPYEFKSSQRTPVRGKRKRKTAINAKIQKKKPIDFKMKGQSKDRSKVKQIVIDLVDDDEKQNQEQQNVEVQNSEKASTSGKNSCMKSGRAPRTKKKSSKQKFVKFEDLEKIKEDLNQAEEYDLIINTQEARDTLTEEEEGRSADSVSNANVIPDSCIDDDTEFAAHLPVIQSLSKSFRGERNNSMSSTANYSDEVDATNKSVALDNTYREESKSAAQLNIKDSVVGKDSERIVNSDKFETSKSNGRIVEQNSLIEDTYEPNKKHNTTVHLGNHSNNSKTLIGRTRSSVVTDSLENVEDVTTDTVTNCNLENNSIDSQESGYNCIPDTCSEDLQIKTAKNKPNRILGKKSVSLMNVMDINDSNTDHSTSDRTSGSTFSSIYDSHPHAKDHGNVERTVEQVGETDEKAVRLGENRKLKKTEVQGNSKRKLRLRNADKSKDTEIEKHETEGKLQKAETSMNNDVTVEEPDDTEESMAAVAGSFDGVVEAIPECLEKSDGFSTSDYPTRKFENEMTDKSLDMVISSSQETVSTQPPSVDMVMEMANQMTKHMSKESTNEMTDNERRQSHGRIVRYTENLEQSTSSKTLDHKTDSASIILETQLSRSQSITPEDSVLLLQTTSEKQKTSGALKRGAKKIGTRNSASLEESSEAASLKLGQVVSQESVKVLNDTEEQMDSGKCTDKNKTIQRRTRNNKQKRSPNVSRQTLATSTSPSGKNRENCTEESTADITEGKLDQQATRFSDKSLDVIPGTVGASNDNTPMLRIPTESLNGSVEDGTIGIKEKQKQIEKFQKCRVNQKNIIDIVTQDSVIVLSGSSVNSAASSQLKDIISDPVEYSSTEKQTDQIVKDRINTYALDKDDDVVEIVDGDNLQMSRHCEKKLLKKQTSGRLKSKKKWKTTLSSAKNDIGEKVVDECAKMWKSNSGTVDKSLISGHDSMNKNVDELDAKCSKSCEKSKMEPENNEGDDSDDDITPPLTDIENNDDEEVDKKTHFLTDIEHVDDKEDNNVDDLTPPLKDIEKDDQNVDGDDLTPTLIPLEKSHHSAKKIMNQSPEDIFMMDSECVDSSQGGQEQFSLIQNLEGIMVFQSVTSQVSEKISQDTDITQKETSQKPDQTKTDHQTRKSKSHSRTTTREDDISDTENRKTVTLRDHRKGEKDEESCFRGNTERQKLRYGEGSDSDLSQEPRCKSGVRTVRGLATRKRLMKKCTDMTDTQGMLDLVTDSCNHEITTNTNVKNGESSNCRQVLHGDDKGSAGMMTYDEVDQSPKMKTRSVVDIPSVIDSEINNSGIIDKNKDENSCQEEKKTKVRVKLRKNLKKYSINKLKNNTTSISAGNAVSFKDKASTHGNITNIAASDDDNEGTDTVGPESQSVIPDSCSMKYLTGDKNNNAESSEVVEKKNHKFYENIEETVQALVSKHQTASSELCQGSEIVMSTSKACDDCQVIVESDEEFFEVSSPLPDFIQSEDITSPQMDNNRERRHEKVSLPTCPMVKSTSCSKKLSDEEDFDVDENDSLIVRKKTVVIGDEDSNDEMEIFDDQKNGAYDEDDDDEVIVKKRSKKPKVINDDDDEEAEEVMEKKRSKKPEVINDNDEDDDDEKKDVQVTESEGYTSDDSTTSRQLNLTSSSAFSSQSEAANTQNRKRLETDLERMRREIAELENQLARNVVPDQPQENGCGSKRKGNRRQRESAVSDVDETLEPQGELDLTSSASKCRSEPKSQTPRSNVVEESDEDSDALILSPLPPSPPPPPESPQDEPGVGIKLPESVENIDVFLKEFHSPNRYPESGIEESKRTPNSMSTCKSATRNARIDVYTPLKNKLPTCSKADNLHNKITADFRSPMFESRTSQATLLRTALSPVISNRDNNEVLSQSQERKAFVATGLIYSQMRELQKLAQQNECKFYTKFNSAVTHVVVKTEPVGSCVCERTLKFFQGVSHRCWILDYQWVVDSKAAGYMLPEAKYEVVGDTVTGDGHKGPRRSRLAVKPLLEGFQICCVGYSDGLTTENLKELISACGGTVISSPDNFTDDDISLVVTCTDLDEEEDVPTPDEVRGFNQIYKKYGVVTVSREWVLDSLTVFNVQPLEEYVLTSVKQIKIPDVTRT